MADNKVPTLDGKRLDIKDINLGDDQYALKGEGRFRRLWRNLNLFLAGMYTGVKCSGIPHSHHTYARDRNRDDAPF